MRQRRTGSLLIEVSVAMLLLAAAFAGVAQLLVAAGREQRAMAQRQLATREAANVLEEIAARPYDQVTMESVAGFELSSEAQQQLPAGHVSIRVVDDPEPPTARQIHVEVGWQNLAGREERVQLTAWKYEVRP
jgi:Tfp pilus assembly protein PilV